MLKLKEKYHKLREQRGRMVLSVWQYLNDTISDIEAVME